MLRKILKDSLPTMLAVMLTSMYGVIDGIFVGTATGDAGLAAINISWPIVAIIAASGIGIGTGGSVLISAHKGRGEIQKAKETYGTILSMLCLVGVILCIILQSYPTIIRGLGATGGVYIGANQYISVMVMGCLVQIITNGLLPVLRNMGMSVHAMLCMTSGLIINICTNYYFMFILKWGVIGAARATIFAQCVVAIGVLVLLKVKGEYGFYFTFKKEIYKKILKAGVTPFGVYLAPTVTLMFTNWQCIRYGGDAVVACFAVISYISFPVQAILVGVGDGTQPLISFYAGAQKETELKKIKKIANMILLCMSGIATVVVVFLSNRIGIWFGLSQEANAYFIEGMPITAFAFVWLAFTKFHTSYLNATMHANKAIILTYLESVLVNPLVLFILPLGIGTLGIWWATLVTALIMLGIYYVMMHKNKSKTEVVFEKMK